MPAARQHPSSPFIACAVMAMDVLRKKFLDAHIEVQTIRSVYPSLDDIFVSFPRRMDQGGAAQ